MNPASVQFLSMVLYISCMLIQIFMYCYYGNEVTIEVFSLLFQFQDNQFEASRGSGAQVCNYKRDWLWVRSVFKEMKYLFKCIFSFLRSGIETNCGVELPHAMPSEFGGK